MTRSTPQPSAGRGGAVACEYRELHGANVHSAESVLVVRIAPGGAGGLAWTLERPSAPLDRCAELLEDLGLPADAVRAASRWPLASLVQAVAAQLIARVNVPPGAAAPAPPADPEREFVMAIDAAAPVPACCELAAAIVFACATAADRQARDRLRGRLDALDAQHPALWPQTAELIAACRRRDIPWARIEGWAEYSQLGEGVLQVRTNRIGSTGWPAVELTSDKTASTGLLARHGIPVAPHIATSRAARAWSAAQQIGLPVVVKPRWTDRGTAVSVGLTTRAEVEAAFHRARQVSRSVLIERLIPGEDHRVLVAGGRFVAAAQRLPAAVLGDGTRTVAELLAVANADPRRTPGRRPR